MHAGYIPCSGNDEHVYRRCDAISSRREESGGGVWFEDLPLCARPRHHGIAVPCHVACYLALNASFDHIRDNSFADKTVIVLYFSLFISRENAIQNNIIVMSKIYI